jgi:hypothetical protein
MSGPVGRSLRGIVTAALSLLIVTGPVTMALADGGPDRVLPNGQNASTQRPGFGDRVGAPSDPATSSERPGFGDQIGATSHPAAVAPRPGFGDRIAPQRPGFGDQIVPAPVPVQAPAPAPAASPAQPESKNWTLLGLLLGGVALALATMVTLATRSRRTPAI